MPPDNLQDGVNFLGRVGKPNLLLAPSTALLLARSEVGQSISSILQGKLGLWLLSVPRFDIAKRLWDVNAPVAG